MRYLGTLLGVTGTYWDIWYHIVVGRDSFWIAPHKMIYFGILLVFLGSLADIYLCTKIKNRKISKAFFFSSLAIFLSVVAQLLSAPIDELWHRLFGLDVTVWSFPHLLIIFAGIFILLFFLYFERLYIHLAHIKKRKEILVHHTLLETISAVLLIGFSIILAEFEFYRIIDVLHSSQNRPIFLYILIFSAASCFVFSLVKTLSKIKFSATKIAIFYIIIRLGTNWLLLPNESWPIMPAAVLISAFIFDFSFKISNKRNIIAAILFSSSFILFQSEYLNIIGAYKLIPQEFLHVFFIIITSIFAVVIGSWVGKKMLKKVNLY